MFVLKIEWTRHCSDQFTSLSLSLFTINLFLSLRALSLKKNKYKKSTKQFTDLAGKPAEDTHRVAPSGIPFIVAGKKAGACFKVHNVQLSNPRVLRATVCKRRRRWTSNHYAGSRGHSMNKRVERGGINKGWRERKGSGRLIFPNAFMLI